MSKKFFLSFLLFFVVSISLVFTVIDMLEKKQTTKEVKSVVVQQSKPIEKSENIKAYKYRKYIHVRDFYKDISKEAVEISLKYNVPPAAVLAIAGVESGYGRGYVANITGNILSLGAKSNEPELPALYLPNLKSDVSKVVYGDNINKYTEDQLEWKNRPESLKQD